MIRLKPYIKIIAIINILVIGSFVSACSNKNEELAKQALQDEFINTYRFITDNDSTYQNKSNQFDYMRKINPDAFHSVAYRWHKIALAECVSVISSNHSPKKSTYEKVIANNTTNELISINNDNARECLIKAYQSHWKEINANLELNYPNAG